MLNVKDYHEYVDYIRKAYWPMLKLYFNLIVMIVEVYSLVYALWFIFTEGEWNPIDLSDDERN